MRIAVSSNGNDLDAPVSPVFGRCPTYIFVDTETMQCEAVSNPAMSAPGGAGIQAAQLVANRGAEAVVTDNVGPNAFNVLQSAGVQVLVAQGGTVREAVEAYKAGRLQPLSAPFGGMSHGMGMGRGRGMGRGMWGGGGWGSYAPSTPQQPGAPPSSSGEELSSLKGQIEALSEQLNEVLKRLDRLEKGE